MSEQPQVKVDSLLPLEIAKKAAQIGKKKAEMNFSTMFVLALLAGAFIGFGAIFATTAATNAGEVLPFGLTKLITGLVFCLGLVLVVVAGAELFTGNNLIVMAWASGLIKLDALLKEWGIVYLGNFIGSVALAVVMFFTRQYRFADGALGRTLLSIANAKCNIGFVEAIALGIMCNVLVCLAVWLTFSGRTVTDKVLAILFPITAFVAAGFEHSVANMYFISIGLLVKGLDPEFAASTGLDLANLDVGHFLINNLLPVTIGNIIGGAILVAAVYWFVYLRDQQEVA